MLGCGILEKCLVLEIKKEFEEVTSRDQYLSKEIEDLQKSAETLKTLIADLDLQLDIQFKDGILKINKAFGEYFVLMFGGGSASLEVIKEQKRKKKSDSEFILDDNDGSDEEDDAGEEGIEVAVSLPNKRVKGLSMLSGGERALTSIALLFAISQVNPPPFIILDETDAALDEANSRKYGDMVENLAKHSQLIVITHNRETMSRAGILYGITMGTDGYSKLLSVKFDEAVAVAK
jgi:chromosome segregation protein